MTVQRKSGRPPRYRSREEIETLIEQYFKDCEGRLLEDKEGNPVLDRRGKPVVLDRRPPTVTGLALALGFTNRLSLLSYQGKAEFKTVITRAKSRVEQYTEERLFDRDGVNGAKFSLTNNFRGWTSVPRTDPEENGENIRQFLRMLRPDEKELRELYEEEDGCGEETEGI